MYYYEGIRTGWIYTTKEKQKTDDKLLGRFLTPQAFVLHIANRISRKGNWDENKEWRYDYIATIAQLPLREVKAICKMIRKEKRWLKKQKFTL